MYKKIQHLHFVGIGGIGMSGIAEILLNLGYRISGSDQARNANVERLEKLGATIYKGHDEKHIFGADAVVRSSAVTEKNPEICRARKEHIPVVRRAEMLAELMRLKYGIAIAGAHGTTTSLVATVLGEAGLDPTVVNGGIVNALGSNAKHGLGEFLVTEADESDGSFLKLTPTIAVVTNLDREHMEHYGSYRAIRKAFRGFVEKVPFYGLAVLCRDHPDVKAMLKHLGDKQVATYGFSKGADYRAVKLTQNEAEIRFTVVYRQHGRGKRQTLGEIRLALPGEHNVQNALATIAVARELEIEWPVIQQAIAQFRGVQRRFSRLLETPERVVIDDYAHHPTEIAATLAAARKGYGDKRRLVAFFQPHRYSRVGDHLKAFQSCFKAADLVLVDPIYEAGEKRPVKGPLKDGGQKALVEGIRRLSGVETHPLPVGEGWKAVLEAHLQAGDLALFLGAGDVSRKAHEFAGA